MKGGTTSGMCLADDSLSTQTATGSKKKTHQLKLNKNQKYSVSKNAIMCPNLKFWVLRKTNMRKKKNSKLKKRLRNSNCELFEKTNFQPFVISKFSFEVICGKTCLFFEMLTFEKNLIQSEMDIYKFALETPLKCPLLRGWSSNRVPRNVWGFLTFN